MTFSRRTLAFGATAALLAACLPGAAFAAGTKSIAYFMPGDSTSTAYLIDWQPRARARVVAGQGVQSGSVVDSGGQKLVTLDGPLPYTYDAFDSCDNAIQQRQDTLQVVVRDLPGAVSQIVEIGTITNLGGCEDGLVTPFGSPSDEGASKKRLEKRDKDALEETVTFLERDRATSARVYANPMPVPEAFDVVESWLQFPQAVMLEPGPRHLGIMRSLLEPIGTAANLTTDAHLGALAIEHNAELVSFDNDFARFPGVRWTMPTVP